MENTLILQGITVEQLISKIDSIVEKRLAEKLIELKEKPAVKYLVRKEVCQILKISLPTLHDWTQNGMITSYRIDSRILYKLEDIEEALTKRKFRK